MNTHTHDPIARMTIEESRELNERNFIDENIQSPICNDEQDWVILRAWFRGDKRDGVMEVFYCCENPPSDIDNYIFDFIYDMTGLTRDLFKGAKVIRVYDEKKVEEKHQRHMAEFSSEDLNDLTKVCIMAQAALELLADDKAARSAAIERWASRASHGKALKELTSDDLPY